MNIPLIGVSPKANLMEALYLSFATLTKPLFLGEIFNQLEQSTRNMQINLLSLERVLVQKNSRLPRIYFFLRLIDFLYYLGWDEFVLKNINQWRDEVICRLPHLQKGGILHYENLIRDRSNELRKLVKFLNMPLDEQRLKCTLKHDFQKFKRERSKVAMYFF